MKKSSQLIHDNNDFLREFEKKIPLELLKEFKNSSFLGTWNGEIAQETL